MRRRDGRLNNLLACPIIELSVRDAGHLGGHSATVAALDLLSIDVGEQLPPESRQRSDSDGPQAKHEDAARSVPWHSPNSCVSRI